MLRDFGECKDVYINVSHKFWIWVVLIFLHLHISMHTHIRILHQVQVIVSADSFFSTPPTL